MKQFTIIGLLLTLILNSCQKDASTDNQSTQPELLKKFVVLDTSEPAPNDTLYIYNYSYDSLNRCTQIKFFDYQNNDIGYTYNYYIGNDTLISSRRLINQVYSDSVIEYFSYDANGQMLSDSVLMYNGAGMQSFVYKYQLIGNSITSTITANGQPLIIGKYIVTKDNNGNTIFEKDSCFTYSVFSSSYEYTSTSNISNSYDLNPCPFYNLYPKRLVWLNYELLASDDVPFYTLMQKNNTKTNQMTTLPTSSGLGDSDETFQYTYNSNNYPSSVIYIDLIYGDVYKGIYYY